MRPVKAHPVHLFMGLVVWSIYFVVVYGGLSVACEFASPDPQQGAWTWVNAAVLLVTMVTTAGLLLWAYWCYQAAPTDPTEGRFMMRVSAAVYLLSAAATLPIGLPGAFLPPCV